MAPRLLKRSAFFTPNGQDAAEFAVAANKRYPHIQKSVAVVGVRKDGTEMCFLKPKKVEADIRIPPQGRVQDWRSDPRREAQRIVIDTVNLMIPVNQFHYLGYGFTDRHHADGSVTENGKLLHWLCTGFGDDPQLMKTFKKNDYSEIIEWWRVEGVLGQMAEIGLMSERKLYLLECAIAEMPLSHETFKAQVFQDLAIAAPA
tara:strand:+ start:4460 stop:5065 length:606 start_codon:yes stop_codon:yes gene_type:complete